MRPSIGLPVSRFSVASKEEHIVPLASDNFIRIRRVVERTGLSRATIYRKVRRDTFPHPRQLGANCVGWYESEIDAWILDPH